MGKSKVLTLVSRMDAVDRFVVLCAQLLLAAMVLLTFVSVVLRTFFESSVPDDLLMQEMLMVAIVFLPLSYVQSLGGHLEVTVFSDLLPKPMQDVLVTLGLFLGVLVFGGMTYLAWLSAHEAYVSGQLAYATMLGVPEWPAKMLIPIGLAWWCLRMMVQLFVPATRPEVADTELRQALEDEKYLTEGQVPEVPTKSRNQGGA